MSNEFVVGFAFIEYYGTNVVLIEKKRPVWQIGYLNGVGGHIEPIDDTPLDAMIREFTEETGSVTHQWQWKPVRTRGFSDGTVLYVFACWLTGSQIFVQSKTDEEVKVFPYRSAMDIPTHPLMDVPRLIAYSRDVLDGKETYKQEMIPDEIKTKNS